MKYLLATTILIASFLAASAYAEPDFLKTKALSFNFNGLNLSGPNGGVSGKLWLSEQRALVLGLNAGLSSNTREGDSVNVEDVNDQSRLGISLSLQQHVSSNDRLSPYIVGGVSAGYEYYKREYGSVDSPYENSDRSTYMGVTGGFGVEYWITRRFSLAGQQLLSVSYRLGKLKSGGASSQSDRDSWGYNAGLGTSSLILSAYF